MLGQVAALKEQGWQNHQIISKPLKAHSLHHSLQNPSSESGHEEEWPQGRASPVSVSQTPRSAREVRVLVVEDELTQWMSLLHLLVNEGCVCQRVDNGMLALEVLEHTRFDIVFMDLHMPVMGGAEATRHFRELEAANGWSPTPIVGLTSSAVEDGSPQLESYTECRAVGMDYLGTKPLSLGRSPSCLLHGPISCILWWLTGVVLCAPQPFRALPAGCISI